LLAAFSIALLLLVLSPGLAPAAGDASYVNQRYGFSLSWPAGDYAVSEAANGDGITVTDGRGLELRAWGSHSPGVLNETLKDILKKQAQAFSKVTYKTVKASEGWFVLSGIREGKVAWVKVFCGKETLYAVDVSYPKKAKARCDALVGTVNKTFAPPRGWR
jgi:hypothetical protein